MPDEPRETIEVDAAHYRSLILQKLQSDIRASRAALEQVESADVGDLQNMGYWKMGYWKMKYWKMGLLERGEEVINPAFRREQ